MNMTKEEEEVHQLIKVVSEFPKTFTHGGSLLSHLPPPRRSRGRRRPVCSNCIQYHNIGPIKMEKKNQKKKKSWKLEAGTNLSKYEESKLEKRESGKGSTYGDGCGKEGTP